MALRMGYINLGLGLSTCNLNINIEIYKNILSPYPHSHHVFVRWRFHSQAVLVFRWLRRYFEVLPQRRNFKVSMNDTQHNDNLMGGESTSWTLIVSILSWTDLPYGYRRPRLAKRI